MDSIKPILKLLLEASKQKSLKKRFLSKISKQGGHWLWKGHVSSVTGKPQMWVNNKVYPAGRVAWMLYKGSPPASGHVVKNTCGKKSCCNPNHLEMSKNKNKLKKQSDKKDE